MSGPADRSHSDIEVLQSGNRSKLVALAAIVAIAGGAWWMTRGGPIGQKEDAASIMIVTQGTWHYRHLVEDLGFKVLEQREDAFVAKAREVMPELEETGVAAVMKLADYGGYGYVAFEDPKSVDFGGLEVEGGLPTFTDKDRFAVISAGDFAFPHKLTVTPERADIVPGADLDLLTALFQQDLLAKALKDDPKNPPDVLILQNSLESAIERVNSIAEAERTIGKIHEASRALLTDQERAKPAPTLLGNLSESVHAIALADGSVLLPTREAKFFSKNGLSADLDLDETWRFVDVPPTGGERQTCAGVFGGSFEQPGRRPRLRNSPEGDALLVDTGAEIRLFTLQAGGGPCNFVDRGVFPTLRREDDPGVPHVSGAVARGRTEMGDEIDAVVEILGSNGDPPLDLLRSTKLGVAAPVWIDVDHLAVVVNYRESAAGQSVLLLSRHHPGVALEVGPQVFAGSFDVYAVATVPGSAAKPELVVSTAGPHLPRLFRLDLPGPLPGLFDAAIAAAPPPSADAPLDVRILALDPATLATTQLTEDGTVSDPVVSPDGKWVTFAVHALSDEKDGDDEIGLARVHGEPEQRTLTRNAVEDHSPMFTGDSKYVVFRTKYPIERTTWTLTTARSLAVE
ncbi:MAG: hypothetical protein R3B09_11595 [Nannocystaceae bacterium]